MKGKNYANRKPEKERPENDFYETPKCMVEELLQTKDQGNFIFNHSPSDSILDPCCGKYTIGNVLRKHNYNNITENDVIYGQDFLAGNLLNDSNKYYNSIVMNPPFKLFDDFVKKSKTIADKVYCIGKMNYFGGHYRNINGLWNNLEWILPFDRMIAFDRPIREDMKVECGMMVTAWFIWNKNYSGYPKVKVLDMQKYILRSGK